MLLAGYYVIQITITKTEVPITDVTRTPTGERQTRQMQLPSLMVRGERTGSL